jgi:hypothetical protein
VEEESEVTTDILNFTMYDDHGYSDEDKESGPYLCMKEVESYFDCDHIHSFKIAVSTEPRLGFTHSYVSGEAYGDGKLLIGVMPPLQICGSLVAYIADLTDSGNRVDTPIYFKLLSLTKTKKKETALCPV